MSMRALLAIGVCLLLLALSLSPARAGHDGTPLIGPMALGNYTQFNLSETGTFHVEGGASGEYGQGEYEGDVRFSWSGSIEMRSHRVGAVDEPDLRGIGQLTWRAAGSYAASQTTETGTSRVDCTLDVSGTAPLHASAVMWNGSAALTLLVRPEVPPISHDDWTCVQQRAEGHEGVDMGVFRLYPTAYPLKTLSDEENGGSVANDTVLRRLQWGEPSRDWAFVLNATDVLPIPGAIVEFPFDRAMGMASSDAEDIVSDSPSAHWCANGESFPDVYGDHSGKCRFRSTVTLSTEFNSCNMLKKAMKNHVRELQERTRALSQESNTADRGLPETGIERAYEEKLRPVMKDLISEERAYNLLGCPEHRSYLPEVRGSLEVVSKALFKTDRNTGLTCKGLAFWLHIDQQAGMLGSSESHFTEFIERLRACDEGKEPAYKLKAAVHSPVSLHAYDSQGRHVGWNNATGGPEVGIPGATYEGRPMEAQTLTLPPGYYKIVVDELARGTYTLDLGAGPLKIPGDLARTVETRPGRSIAMAVALTLGPDEKERLEVVGSAVGPTARMHEGYALSDRPTVQNEDDQRPGGNDTTPGSVQEAGSKGTPAVSAAVAAMLVIGVAVAYPRRRV